MPGGRQDCELRKRGTCGVTNSQLLPIIALRAHEYRRGGRMPTELSLARRVAWTWIVVVGLFYCYDILRDTGGSLTDPTHRPLGDDYVNFWSGAFLAWHGRVADVYKWSEYHAFQQSIVGDLGTYLYAYPPVLLILTAPL